MRACRRRAADTHHRATNASSKPTAHHQNQHRQHRANSPPEPLGKRGRPTAIISSPKCSVRWNGYRPRGGSCRDQDQEPVRVRVRVPGRLRTERQQLERGRRRLRRVRRVRGVRREELPRQLGDEDGRTGDFSSCIASPLCKLVVVLPAVCCTLLKRPKNNNASPWVRHNQRATPLPHVAFYDAPRAQLAQPNQPLYNRLISSSSSSISSILKLHCLCPASSPIPRHSVQAYSSPLVLPLD
jgi:hypothetical protein